MNLAQRVVVLATAAVVAGLLLSGGTPVSITGRESALQGGWSIWGGVTDSGCRILAVLVLGAALLAVLHRRKPS